MIKLITKIFLMLVLLISAASICAAQWEDGSGSDETNPGWGVETTNVGPETGTNGGINQNTDSWGSPPPAEVSEPSDEAYFPRRVAPVL
jgi:pectate lyase